MYDVSNQIKHSKQAPLSTDHAADVNLLTFTNISKQHSTAGSKAEVIEEVLLVPSLSLVNN